MSTKPQAMQIPALLVKELRKRTSAGFSDCRAALVEAGGDIEKALVQIATALEPERTKAELLTRLAYAVGAPPG